MAQPKLAGPALTSATACCSYLLRFEHIGRVFEDMVRSMGCRRPILIGFHHGRVKHTLLRRAPWSGRRGTALPARLLPESFDQHQSNCCWLSFNESRHIYTVGQAVMQGVSNNRDIVGFDFCLRFKGSFISAMLAAAAAGSSLGLSGIFSVWF